jgi:hypothetical protein
MTQDTVGWSVIRTATGEDRRRLQHAAYRFCRRHHFDASALDRIGGAHEMPDFAHLVDEEITLLMGHDRPPHVRAYGKRMRRLWRECVRRALHEPRADGIAASCIVRRDTSHSQSRPPTP